MANDVRIVDLGLGKVVSNFGTYHGVPCVFLEPVLGELGTISEKVEDGREPQITKNSVSDGGVIIVIHDRKGLEVLLEDFESALKAQS